MKKNKFGIGKREIEFRAWIEGKMVFKDYIWQVAQVIHPKAYIFDMNLKLNHKLEKEKNAAILMQYTGLKDKNGKKIFEGDIAIFKTDMSHDLYNHDSPKEFIGYVWYCESLAQFRISTGCEVEEEGDAGFNAFHGGQKIKIIGNIFENPELIPETK